MLNINSSTALERVLSMPIDQTLKRLLALRREQLAEYDDDLVSFLIVEAGDPIAAITASLGFSPFDEPCFEWVADHGGWLEAPVVFSDDGAGVVLIVQDRDGVDADLLALLRHYAVPAQGLGAETP